MPSSGCDLRKDHAGRDTRRLFYRPGTFPGIIAHETLSTRTKSGILRCMACPAALPPVLFVFGRPGEGAPPASLAGGMPARIPRRGRMVRRGRRVFHPPGRPACPVALRGFLRFRAGRQAEPHRHERGPGNHAGRFNLQRRLRISNPLLPEKEKNGEFVSSFGEKEWLWPQDPFMSRAPFTYRSFP